ncbi:MAG: hypothetical protein ABEI57_05650 [Halapricum sp.]
MSSTNVFPKPVASAVERIAQYYRSMTGDSFRYRAEAQVDTVEDGDTWFGRHKPDPTIVVATDANHRDDDKGQDGQYYRLSRVDTHETDASNTKKQQMATEEKQAVQAFIDQGRQNYSGEWPFVIEYESVDVEGTYGRRLVDLVRKSDGKELNDWLLNEKFPDRNIEYNPST